MNEQERHLPVVTSGFFILTNIEVDEDENLTDKEKRLFGRISLLTNQKGYCFASNKYLEDCLKTSQQTISKGIKNLKNRGYIWVEYITNEKTKEIIERRIYLNLTSTKYTNKLKEGCTSQVVQVYKPGCTGVQARLYSNNINNNNISNSSSETSCLDPNTSEPKPISGTERKFQKIYDRVVERIETLSEKGIIPAVRKLTGVRSALIKDRIKEEPSLPYWMDLFDRIEDDADIYSKENWFDLHFLFRAESKKGGNSREKVLSGHYDFLRGERNSKSAADDASDDLPFDEDEANQVYLELKQLVKDNMTEEKMDELSDVILAVNGFQRPDNHVVAGNRHRGFVNYRDTFSMNWNKVYQNHIARYHENHPTMPMVVSMIKLGSECWQAFERDVENRWTVICFLDELQEAQDRFDGKI